MKISDDWLLQPTCGLVLAITLLSFPVAGCVSHEAEMRQETSGSTSRQAAALLANARHTQNTSTRIGLMLAAADKASQGIAEGDDSDARALYNAACAELAVLLKKSASPPTLPAMFATPTGSYVLKFDSVRDAGRWQPSYFTRLLTPADLKSKDFVSKQRPAGYGGVLVGVHCPPNPRAMLLPRIGVSAPVTAVVNFSKPAQSDQQAQATLTLYDSARQSTGRVAGKDRPLAADLRAPFGFYRPPAFRGILGMLRPQKYSEKEGFFLVQPYESKKIPIVFVHGLMAVPYMWAPVMAALESDPVLRGKFQFWVFFYPTGNPIAYSALRLRQALKSVYDVYPGTQDMVIINHSLGGDLTHLQVINTGDALMKGIFKDNASRMMAELPADSLVKQALIFKANPRIKRVVFICAPHRGAPLASNQIGIFGARLILVPVQILKGIGSAALRAAASAAGVKGAFLPNSIRGLEPNSPLLLSMNTVPIESPFHSIIGNSGRWNVPLKESSDGVVPYWSSHLDRTWRSNNQPLTQGLVGGLLSKSA
jgi:triacylglycerol esterase/lipase EstA (alpha/beta hydrolase family)